MSPSNDPANPGPVRLRRRTAKTLFASALALLGLTTAVLVGAMQIAPLGDAGASVALVAYGCGPEWTRGPYGRCHPMGYAPGQPKAFTATNLMLTPTPTAGAGGAVACASAPERARGVGLFYKPAPHAAALGRAFSVSRQRLRLASSGRMAMRAGLAKSSATSPVMSATGKPGDEVPLAQRLVDNRHCSQRPGSIGGRPVGNLRLLHLRHVRTATTQHLCDRQEQAQFELALPHLDHS
jgi:hypothetical protein